MRDLLVDLIRFLVF